MAFDLAAYNAGLGSLFGHNEYQQQNAPPPQYNLGTMYGTNFGGQLPTQSTGSAPSYSTSGLADYFGGNAAGAQNMDPALRTTLTAANAGTLTRGVQAFLGQGWQPTHYEQNGAEQTYSNNGQDLSNLASQVGFDASGYNANMDDQQRQNYLRQGFDVGSTPKGVNALTQDLNDYTKNYYGVTGLSAGWNPNSTNWRDASRTLYRDNGQGNLEAVSNPVEYRAPERSGFWKQEGGRELLTALSMVAPAFGGAAGILGSGTTGTLSAGAGLGVTTPVASAIGTGATNALVNAGVNGLMSGSPQGALTSLVGSGMGAAGNSVMGRAGGLGDMFNTSGAGAATSVNPMSYYRQALGASGLGGSPLGQGMGYLNNARTLADLLNRA